MSLILAPIEETCDGFMAVSYLNGHPIVAETSTKTEAFLARSEMIGLRLRATVKNRKTFVEVKS